MTDEIIKPNFVKCLRTTGTQYYKKTFFWGCVIIAACAIGYGLAVACATLFPLIVNAAISIPMWIYIPVSVLLAPGIATIVVCYIRHNKKEMEIVDKDYVCPE